MNAKTWAKGSAMGHGRRRREAERDSLKAYRIEVAMSPDLRDAAGEALKDDILDLGIESVRSVRTAQVYRLEGDLSRADVERIASDLLADGVSQRYSIGGSAFAEGGEQFHAVEVAYNPGVMDPVAISVLKAIADLGISGVDRASTAQRYCIEGALSEEALATITNRLLVNRVIQHLATDVERTSLPSATYRLEIRRIPITDASPEELEELSDSGQLFLDRREMAAIQDYFRGLGREPTDVELETLAQTWSEHCVHKTMRGRVDYGGHLIDGLLQSTIVRATKELAKDWCISVFEDNAGIIAFDDEYNICFKVETHNHPSALEPYGGAGTGIGGVLRDPMGTGLGAKPILSTDVFCFAPPDTPYDALPDGVLHPKRIMKGVVAGVRDYGNRMGVPTVNGAVLFDEGYLSNPVIYCGNVGLIPRNRCEKRVSPGDMIVLVGGRTGRDGIHGATFSSGELTPESEVVSAGAVQIGNPIVEKKLLDALLEAREKELYRCITDCGGGGLSSAVGEMGQDVGVLVDLEKVPLKYEGLRYDEIWISEAQERMILAVPPDKVEECLQAFADEDVEATVIGTFTGDGQLRLHYDGTPVGDLSMEFLHRGYPRSEKAAEWTPPTFGEPEFGDPGELGDWLLSLLGSWNIASKEWVVRQYDHEVQGGSVLKPLVGALSDGPGDAAVWRPRLDSYRGIAVANGINAQYGKIDPYWMAASVIDEALRQIVAVGASLDHVALLDNFSWGDPDDPQQLAGLVRACQGCYDIAKVFGTPFISGKDSLNNCYLVDGNLVSIPPTLLVSALAVVDDVRACISMDLKEPGDYLYIVGLTYEELGGSQYYCRRGLIGNRVPRVDAHASRRAMSALSRACRSGLVRSCHDCSEGGLGVAAAEMAFAGNRGLEIDLARVSTGEQISRNDYLLFSESNSRFLVEVHPDRAEEFEAVLGDVRHARIGVVCEEGRFVARGLGGENVMDLEIAAMREAWQAPLRW